MKTNSKLFAFAVMAFMLAGAFAIVADQGGSDADVGDTFNEGDYTYTILSEDGTTGTVSIAATTPTTYAGPLDLSTFTQVEHDTVTYTITGISDNGFQKASNLGSVILNENVVSIGATAFNECAALTGINLSNVTTIGHHAFAASGLTSVEVPASVTTVDAGAFERTPLTSVTWGPSTIPGYAFNNCKALTGINLSNVTTIGDHAFSGCTALTGINLANVTTIRDVAFSGSGLTSVEVPASVTTFGIRVFENTPLTSVTWGLSTIPDYTFSNCAALASLTLNNTVTSIGLQAFLKCAALTGINLSNVTTIGNHAFSESGLTSVEVPAGATNVGTGILQKTPLTSVTWGPSTIPSYAFNECVALTEVNFSNVTTIGDNAFRGCTALTGFDFTNVETINYNAFYNSGLTSAVFPHDVTIYSNAFAGTQIRSITFDGETNSIDNLNAFPKAGYTYANGAILDDWSPVLTATPAGGYVATFEQQADSWTTEPSIATEFTYGDSITYTEGVAASGNAVTYTYVGMGATVYAESATVPTDAGTYALHAATAESDEYKSLSLYCNFTIVPATNTWTTPFAMDTTSFTYPDTVTYTPGEATYGEVYYVITEANNGAVDGWPTEVGTYSVYAVVDETVNYNGLTTAETPIQFTIALPSGDDVAMIDGTTYSTIAAAQEAGLTEFIVAADMDLVEDVVLASGQSIIFVTGASFTGSIEYTTDAETPVTSGLRAINLVAGSPIVIAPGSIELSGTMSADYLVLSGDVVVTANTTISAGTMLVISDDAAISNQNEATLTIEAGAYYYNEGAALPADSWFVNNGTAVAADYIGDNEVAVTKNSAGQVYLTLEIEGAYVGDVTGAGFVRVSWTVTDSEDAAIENTGEVSYPNDADTFGVLVGDLTPGDYTISMYMYYTYGYSQVVRSISVDKPFTVLPQDVIIGAYYSYSAYHAVLYNVRGDNLDAGSIYVDAFTAQTGELSDGTEYQYIAITSTLTAEVDGTTAGGAYDLEGTVDIDNMVALQPWYQIAGSSAKLYAFETVAYSTTPTPVTPDVNAYSDLAAVVSIAVEGEVTGGVWVYAVDALDGAVLTAVVDSENTYTAEVTIGAGEFKFFEFANDFVVSGTDTPADISAEDIAYFLITAVTLDGDTVTDAHLSLVVLDYQ